MKIPSGIYIAVGFVLLLILITGVVWLAELFISPSNTAGSSSGKGFFGSLFPFGTESNTPNTGGVGNNNTSDAGPVPALRKVSDAPVAGARFVTGLDGALSIRYIERNTGHMYETPVDALTALRLTNTTAPGVRDALWITASSTLMRFLTETGSIENFVGSFTATSTDQQMQGVFLKNYDRVALGAGGTILGLTQTTSGSVLETVLSDGTKPKQLLVSPLSSWVPLAAGNKYFVASAPTAGIPGALYDISDGSMKKIAGNINGLQVVLNPNANEALLSAGSQNTLSLYTLDVASGNAVQLPRGTLAAKCTWVPNQIHKALCGFPQSLPQGAYPDDWLLGRVHTSDELWFIDTETTTFTSAMQLEQVAGVPLDIMDVQMSTDGRYALFINRTDHTLWSATIQPAE